MIFAVCKQKRSTRMRVEIERAINNNANDSTRMRVEPPKGL